MTIEHILEALNRQKIRATYKAVGKVLDINAMSVGKLLGQRRPEASWIVSSKTGEPTGYPASECHEDLYTNPTILRTREQLLTILE